MHKHHGARIRKQEIRGTWKFRVYPKNHAQGAKTSDGRVVILLDEADAVFHAKSDREDLREERLSLSVKARDVTSASRVMTLAYGSQAGGNGEVLLIRSSFPPRADITWIDARTPRKNRSVLMFSFGPWLF